MYRGCHCKSVSPSDRTERSVIQGQAILTLKQIINHLVDKVN